MSGRDLRWQLGQRAWGRRAALFFWGLIATKSLTGLEFHLEGLKQFFMPCGFTGQRLNSYSASVPDHVTFLSQVTYSGNLVQAELPIERKPNQITFG